MSKEIRLLTALGFKDIYSCTLQEISFDTEENCSANREKAPADVTSQKTTRLGASMKRAFVASAWLSRPGTQRCSVILRTPGRIQVFRVELSLVGSPRTAHTWTVLDLLTCDCLWHVIVMCVLNAHVIPCLRSSWTPARNQRTKLGCASKGRK